MLYDELSSSGGGANTNNNTQSSSIVKDPTGAAGIRLAEHKRLQTLEQEIDAVMKATATKDLIDGTRANLKPEQREVIRQRYWQSDKWNPGGRRKPRPYEYLQDLGYNVDHMKWICKKVILKVAEYLGEK